MRSTFFVVCKWLSYLLLVCVMIGGVVVIMHDPSYELSDDTMIQTHIGIGRMHLMNEKPVFSPEEGRFFPLGYQHFNLLLLMSPTGVSASMVYAFESVLWCFFLLAIFCLCGLALPKSVDGVWQYVIPLCVVIIVAQRTLQYFTVLWTCSTFAYLILVLQMIAWFYYCCDGKYWQLGVLSFLAAYYTFCGEANVVVPFMIGLCVMLNINRTDNRDMPLIYSMVGIVVLFIGLYMALIFPNISFSYDPAHGENISFVSNAVGILLNQKLLFLTVAIFVWRLYKVFVDKEGFDMFSDTLLATSFAIMSANLVLKLNYPIYYVSAILLSIPAYLRALDFSSKTKKIISISIVVSITLYFIPKYNKLVLSIWHRRTETAKAMREFDENCNSNGTIVWFMDKSENRGVEDGWARGHVGSHLIYLKHKPVIEFPNDSIKLLPEFLLVTPASHTLDDVMPVMGIEENEMKYPAIAPSIRYYQIHREIK